VGVFVAHRGIPFRDAAPGSDARSNPISGSNTQGSTDSDARSNPTSGSDTQVDSDTDTDTETDSDACHGAERHRLQARGRIS